MSIANHSLSGNWTIYPNPTNDITQLSWDDADWEMIYIYNSWYELIEVIDVSNKGSIELNSSSYSNGSYFIVPTNKSGVLVESKLMLVIH